MKHISQIFAEFKKYAAEKWWDLMTEEQQRRYLSLHPDSDLRINPKTKAQKTHESLKNFPPHVLEHLEILHPGVRGWAANQIMGPNLKGLWKSVNKRLSENPHDISLHNEKDQLLKEIKKEVRSKRRSLSKINDWAVSESPDINALDLSVALEKANEWRESQKEIEKQLTKHDDGRKIPMSDGLYAIKLEKRKELKQEGAEMTHCVGSYCRSVRSGDTHIYSIRTQNSDDPIATLEISPNGGVRQIKGKSNKAVDQQYANSIKEWLDQNNFNYDGSHDFKRMMSGDGQHTTVGGEISDRNLYLEPDHDYSGNRNVARDHRIIEYENRLKKKVPVNRVQLETMLDRADLGKGKRDEREMLSENIKDTFQRTSDWPVNDLLRFMKSRLQTRGTEKLDSNGHPRVMHNYGGIFSSMPMDVASEFYEKAIKDNLQEKINKPDLNSQMYGKLNLKPGLFEAAISGEKRKLKNVIDQYDNENPGQKEVNHYKRRRFLSGDGIYSGAASNLEQLASNPHVSQELRSDINKFLLEEGINRSQFYKDEAIRLNSLLDKNKLKLSDDEFVDVANAAIENERKTKDAGGWFDDHEVMRVNGRLLEPQIFEKATEKKSLNLISTLLKYKNQLSSNEIDELLNVVSNIDSQNEIDKTRKKVLSEVKSNLINRNQLSPEQLRKMIFNNNGEADASVAVSAFNNPKIDRDDLKTYLKSLGSIPEEKHIGHKDIGKIVRRKDYGYDLADSILFDENGQINTKNPNVEAFAKNFIDNNGLTAEQALKFKKSDQSSLREAIAQYRRIPYEMIKDMANDPSSAVRASVKARHDRHLKDMFKKRIDKYKKDQEKLNEFQSYLENSGLKYSSIIQNEFNLLNIEQK